MVAGPLPTRSPGSRDPNVHPLHRLVLGSVNSRIDYVVCTTSTQQGNVQLSLLPIQASVDCGHLCNPLIKLEEWGIAKEVLLSSREELEPYRGCRTALGGGAPTSCAIQNNLVAAQRGRKGQKIDSSGRVRAQAQYLVTYENQCMSSICVRLQSYF